MEKIYLSDSISDADSFSITELNLIVAPAGSGKTYFALTKLPDLLKIEHKERILYLIDTCAAVTKFVISTKTTLYSMIRFGSKNVKAMTIILKVSKPTLKKLLL